MKQKTLLLLGLCIAVCLFAATVLYAAGEQEPSEGMAGKTVAVLHHNSEPWNSIFKNQIPRFEAETGIKVVVDWIPEQAQMAKVMVVMNAKSDEYDVIWYRGNLVPGLLKTEAMEPLDSYIEASKKSDKAFDYDDFLFGTRNAFNFDGKQWGLPMMGGGNVLFYNKEHLKEAGLNRPPKNVNELEEWARKLKTDDHAGFALRGKGEGTNVYPWVFIWKIEGAKRYGNIKGNWFNDNWEPQLATREAIGSVERWARMLQDYGPEGIASYSWQECQTDFQQGWLSMWMDDAVFVSNIEDPKQSKVVGKAGYAVVEGPGKLYGAVAPWGFIMNGHSKNKDASWEFIKFASSSQTLLNMAAEGYGLPTRQSVLDSATMKETLPADYLVALAKAMDVADPAYKSLIPTQAEINNLTSIALSKVLTKQATAAEAMKALNDEVAALMKRDGYLK